jgi:glucose/arabinose dehydrogenase
MQARALAPIALAVLVGVLACLLFARPATTLPPDFVDSPVTNVPAPTALAFTPDGRLLVTSKSGQLHVFDQNGNELSSPALNLGPKVCDNSERGLLGVAVDPSFSTNGYVYLYYTFKKHRACPVDKPARNDNPVNRVSRFTMSGDTANPQSEKVLINNIPSPNGNHNAGDLKFGKDGYLYISVGDGGCNFARPKLCQYDNGAARYRHVLLGKILRVQVNPDGTTSIPPGNPYMGPQSARCADNGRTARDKTCQEIFALGFRNPFRFAVDPDTTAPTTRIFINDVGGQRWEEIDEADAVADAGADYGWNLCEGHHDNPERRGRMNCDGSRYTGPIHEYNHATNCESITGGAFVPNDGSWPDAYDDSYLFADFVCNKIFELEPQQDGTGFDRNPFANVANGGPISMVFSPSGTKDLYYTTFAGGGQVRRIAYTGP